ncbi:MAG: family 43 glycosylhydrolase, partial [Bryobacteraceae bacterium]
MFTRRSFLRTAANASAALTLAAPRHRLLAQTNSVYRNPILGGDHPDASPIRAGNEFFLTHSSFDYAPGLLIWRSPDLVNWKPVAAALDRYAGSVWAPYLCEYEGRFYIYFPADNRLRVVHAEHPLGPW